MILAYHGDVAIRSDVIARLWHHAEAGTLSFGMTWWDGTHGSALGVAAESDASDDYAARFGYPLALAGLLDPIVASSQDGALDTTIAWHDCVEPGSDLSAVPLCIVRDLLGRLGASELGLTHYGRVIEAHRREAKGDLVGRIGWAQLRAEIEMAAVAAEGAARIALQACAVVCWPLASSRSVLVGLVHAWTSAGALAPDPDFGEDDRRRADAILKGLWQETQPQRDAGEQVDLPGLFRARHSDLSRRFEADIDRTNAARAARAAQAQTIVLHHLAAAGRRE